MSKAKSQSTNRLLKRESVSNASSIRKNNRKTTEGRHNQHVDRKVVRHQSK